MNSSLYFVLFAAAFCSFAAAQPNYPSTSFLNLTSDVQHQHVGQPYRLNCEFKLSKPSRNGENQDSDWELTVGFHKDLMSASPEDRFPPLAEYRQSGPSNMTFHTVKLIDGVNVWPADGKMSTGLQSPTSVVVIPGENDGMMGSPYGQWRCSVTMKRKGTEAKVRYFSSDLYLTPNYSNLDN